ncbi:MAG TPA: proline dehydrogenase family protein [Frankiaceae bacterium]|nr:proline dehydrogenase family protein [Frankiaceae bacterium]
MLRRTILAASRSPKLREAISTMPMSRDVVQRFVAGDSTDDAVRATRELVDAGLLVSLDHLGEDTTEVGHAEAVVKAYLELLGRLDDSGLTGGAEVSVKLSAIGQALDPSLCLDNARRIVEAATAAGTTVTLDMEDHTTTDSTLGILAELRQDFPGTGAVIQAYLRRSAGDVDDLIRAKARVRLCKGAYKEPESVAYQSRKDVDLSYVRLLVRLMADGAYPMVATHDPRLVAIATKLAARREPGSYEFQMLYGIRPNEQRRIVAAGHRMRVYTPYGQEWYGYLMRRMAERPANLQFFLRALATKS